MDWVIEKDFMNAQNIGYNSFSFTSPIFWLLSGDISISPFFIAKKTSYRNSRFKPIYNYEKSVKLKKPSQTNTIREMRNQTKTNHQFAEVNTTALVRALKAMNFLMLQWLCPFPVN